MILTVLYMYMISAGKRNRKMGGGTNGNGDVEAEMSRWRDEEARGWRRIEGLRD